MLRDQSLVGVMCPERGSNPHEAFASKDFTRIRKFPSGADYLFTEPSARSALLNGVPGARRRGLSLGLTPLVSAPSAEPLPSAAWLRIAVRALQRV